MVSLFNSVGTFLEKSGFILQGANKHQLIRCLTNYHHSSHIMTSKIHAWLSGLPHSHDSGDEGSHISEYNRDGLTVNLICCPQLNLAYIRFLESSQLIASTKLLPRQLFR